MRDDIGVGKAFPDLALPDYRGETLSLAAVAGRQPLIAAFARGWW